jgi:NO-binding membrane sensor protein with MHYT domain
VTAGEKPLYTRRRWLTIQAMLGGAPIWAATEAVATVAIEHPEWDMEEEKTWEEWESAT